MITGNTAIENEIAAIEKEATISTALDRQMAVAEAMESIISDIAKSTDGDETYSGLTPDAGNLGFHENLVAGYTPSYGDWRSGSSNLPYDVAKEYGLGLSDWAHGPVIDNKTGYRHGYTVGGKDIPTDIAALFSGSDTDADVEYTDFDWDEEEDYLAEIMDQYEKDYFEVDDRDDSAEIYRCEKLGGTWEGGVCVMPEPVVVEPGPTEEEIFINSFDPFTSINRAKWMHPLAGYVGTSNLWGYQPPQIEDWTPGLKAWAAGD